MKEKISIIIPTYKRAKKLGRAIDSVLNQTYSNIEVIVVDDNSNGDIYRKETSQFMQNYKGNQRVIYLKHKVNKNGSAARNTGIREATGVYIGFLDDDDYFEKERIHLQIQALRDSGVSYGGVCTEHYGRYKKIIYKKEKIKINESGNYIYDLLSGKIVLGAGSTLLVRKDVFDVIGVFDESYQRHQDYEFLLRFFRVYKLAIVNKPLVNVTVDGARNYPSAVKFQRIKEKFLEDFKQDIVLLGEKQKNEILLKQWSEVFLYYIVGFDFRGAKILYNKKIKPTKIKLSNIFYLKVLFLIIERKIPIMNPLKYRVVSLVLKLKSVF